MSNKKQNKKQGKSKSFLYPKKPSGRLYDIRKWVSYFLLLLMFSGPFIKFNGEQLVLLNFLERKFVFIGLIFTPQDFYLFALAMLIMILFIVFFTVIFGRLWCGWVCPQTIFMEMVFRRIEYWIEGDAPQQRKLDQGPWTFEKIWKKGVKHLIFIAISFLIANVFLAYIIGSDQLITIMTEPISEHYIGFFSIWLFTFVFYGVFSYVREVVCTVICPYGRLQGVLLDSQSLVVAYDEGRGEPRGFIQKGQDQSQKGDCIDCNLCVQVCPTGIDIRQGTQLECVNCTACIDACDEVMVKIGKPKKLIGFYSSDYVKNRNPFKLGLRAYGYAVILLFVITIFSSLIYKREDVQITVLRAAGSLYQKRPDGTVVNLYNAELINKTNKDIKFVFKSADTNDKIEFIRTESVLPKEGTVQLTFFLVKPQKTITDTKTKVTFEVEVDKKVISKAKTNFFAQANDEEEE